MNKDDFVKVLEYIEEHITEKISLKDLADFVGYSPYYFSKCFSNVYGIPVTGHIRIRKLQYSVVACLKVVNSLCESLTIKVYRNSKCYQQDYVRGVAQHEILCVESNCEQGTEIIMKPDTVIFDNISFEEEILQEWIQKNNVCNLVVIKNRV